MKTLTNMLFSAILVLCALHVVKGQDALFLSNEKPGQGETLTFTFHPVDTALAYQAELYVFHPSGYNADDIELTDRGGTFVLPDSATAFLLNFKEAGTEKKTGFSYQVYENGKPVEGANAAFSQIYNGYGESFSNVSRDRDKALEYLEAEFASFPASGDRLFYNYLRLVSEDRDHDSLKVLTDNKAARLFGDDKSKERDLIMIADAYEYVLGDKTTADSLRGLILAKSPNGASALSNAMEALRAENDYAKKTDLYRELIAGFGTIISPSRMESVNRQMALAAFQAQDYSNYDTYLSTINDKFNKSSLLNQQAWPLAESGENLEVAAKLSKQSLELLEDIIADPNTSKPAYLTQSQWKRQAESMYRNNADTYALIQYKQGNLEEALAYQRKAIGEYNNTEFNERYVLFLKESGQLEAAQTAAERAILNGKSTAALVDYFKEAYLAAGHDEQQWASHFQQLEKTYLSELRNKLIAQLIDEEAPQFSLVNMQGEEVSSQSLKGKVYVVDFWATWCGPCIASFPGMQMAVDKYKERDDVEFLFVNTWENIPDREQTVEKFIADKAYTFNVLFDTVKGTSNNFDVVSAYKVSGIPTKFVVDKHGRIRFKSVGYSGSAEDELQKISLMIELAENPPTVAAQ